MAKKKSIWETLADTASRAYDQVNPFDNNRTFKQRTPTNSKSFVQQAGQVGGQTARAVAGNTARFVNTANLGARQIADTAKMTVADLTHNPIASGNAQQQARQDYNRFTTHGGVLNTGTFFKSPEEAASGRLSTAARRIGGGTLGTAGEIIPFARGATLAKPGTKLLPTVARGALEGAGYGAVAGVANELTNSDKFNVRNIIRSAATGAALGGGGAAAVPAVRAGAKVVANRTPLNEVGAIGKDISGDTQGFVKPSDGQRIVMMSPDEYIKQAFKKQPNYNPEAHPDAIKRATQYAEAMKNGDKFPIPTISDNAQDGFHRAFAAKMNGIGQIPVELKTTPVKTVKIKGNDSLSPSKNFDSQAYVKEQTARQEAARASSIPAKIRTMADTAKSKFIDTYAPLEDPVKQAMKQGTKIDPKKNITIAIDRVLQSDRIAGQYIKDNGLDKIVQGVPDTKSFDQYLIARHAEDLNKNKIKTGRNAEADAQLVNSLAPQYEPYAQQLNKYNQSLLDKTVEYGLISKETASYLKKQYPNYVPINRIFTDEELAGVKGNGSGPASISTQSVVQRLKGSERQIESPLNSILQKTQSVIEQGERNNAAKILTSYKDLPGNPFNLRQLKSTEQVGARPVISFLENGKVRRYETTPEIAAAAKSLNKEQINLLGRIVSAPTRLLRLGATGVNVGFAAANVARDVATGFINSKQSIASPGVFLDALKASVFHGSPQYGELLREGAAGTSFDIARNQPIQNVARVRAGKNAGTKIAYTVTHPGELLRAVENTIGRSEEFNRAYQYFGNKRAYLKKGQSEPNARLLAAGEARNNTVNFARAGDYGRVLNTVLPYLNAGIQGSRIFIRNLRDRPAQTAAKVAVSTLFPMAAITAWNLNDPERRAAYEDIKGNGEYELQNNFVIIPPHPKKDASGKWNVIKIPMSQEIANLADGVRRGVESWSTDSKFDFGRLATELIGSGTSLQTGSGRELANQFVPQAVKPAVETLANQNLFFGNDIVPDAMKNLAPEDQANKGTSGTAKVVGKLTNQSPLVIDNAIKTATGGVGQQLIRLSDTALAKTGVIKEKDIKGKGFIDSITSRFDQAQGSTAGGLYFKTLQDESKRLKLNGRDYELLNALKAKESDPNGDPIPQDEKDALSNAALRANNPRVVDVEAATAKTLAKKTGQALDPIYNLTPAQRQTYYRIQASPYKGDDYNRLTDNSKSWLPKFQKERSKFFDNLNSSNSTGTTANARVKYPTFSDSTQGKLDQYFAIEDPSQRVQYLKQNGDIQKAFDQINQYTNARRVAQGYDPFADYPKASPEVEQATNAYFALDKDARKAYIKANPGMYSQVQQYLADTAAWQLANNAGSAKYAGEKLNQKALKSAYNLGQYDIYKDESGQYSVNPTLAYLANYQNKYGKRGSGGSGSGSGKISIKKGSYGSKKAAPSGKIKVAKGKKSKVKVAARASAKVATKGTGSSTLKIKRG